MRAVLAFTTLALGLTACAPEGDGKDGVPSPIPGYELASARAVGTSEAAEQYSAYTGEPEQHLADGIKAWRAAGLDTVKPS